MPSTRWWCVSSRSFSNSHPRTQIEMDYREFIFMALLCHFCFCLAINLPKALLLPSLGFHSGVVAHAISFHFIFSAFLFPSFLHLAHIPPPLGAEKSWIWFVIAVVAGEARVKNERERTAWHLNGIFASFAFRLVSVNNDTVSSNVAVSIAIYFAHNKFVFICSGWSRTTMVANKRYFLVMNRLLFRNHDWMAIWWWWESVFTFISPITSFSVPRIDFLSNSFNQLFLFTKTCFFSPPSTEGR